MSTIFRHDIHYASETYNDITTRLPESSACLQRAASKALATPGVPEPRHISHNLVSHVLLTSNALDVDTCRRICVDISHRRLQYFGARGRLTWSWVVPLQMLVVSLERCNRNTNGCMP